MPRHPPIALKTLDRSHCQCPPGLLPTVLARKTSFSRSVRWPAVKPPIIRWRLSVSSDGLPPDSMDLVRKVLQLFGAMPGVEPEQIFSSRCQQNRRAPDGVREPCFLANDQACHPFHRYGGAGRDRTDDPLLAKQVLSQLSYGP